MPTHWVDGLLGRDAATFARQERTAQHPVASALALGAVIAVTFAIALGRSYGPAGVAVGILLGVVASPVGVLEAKRRVRRRGRLEGAA